MLATKAYGIKPEVLDWMCPADIEPYLSLYEIEQNKKDEYAWLQGRYFFEAMIVSLENAFAGKKAKMKYSEKPYSEQAKEKNKELSHEEKMKRVEALFLRLDIMKANYDANHPKVGD